MRESFRVNRINLVVGPESQPTRIRSRCALTSKSWLAYHRPMADVFEALGAPARRAILDELHERNGQTLFELCTRLTMKYGLGLTRQAISQHLDVLEAAGLVTTRREGRYKFHNLNTDPLKEIVERWLKSNQKGAKR